MRQRKWKVRCGVCMHVGYRWMASPFGKCACSYFLTIEICHHGYHRGGNNVTVARMYMSLSLQVAHVLTGLVLRELQTKGGSSVWKCKKCAYHDCVSVRLCFA